MTATELRVLCDCVMSLCAAESEFSLFVVSFQTSCLPCILAVWWRRILGFLWLHGYVLELHGCSVQVPVGLRVTRLLLALRSIEVGPLSQQLGWTLLSWGLRPLSRSLLQLQGGPSPPHSCPPFLGEPVKASGLNSYP